MATVPDLCPQCGVPVITACERCGAGIPRPDYLKKEPNPSFCVGCGEPFPWATRRQRIEKLSSYLDFEDGLSESDRTN
jgi:hypothetical protein